MTVEIFVVNFNSVHAVIYKRAIKTSSSNEFYGMEAGLIISDPSTSNVNVVSILPFVAKIHLL